ncbi:MAG: hypothetical protein A2140_00705 [Candidatus Muproteobacteria bacterium RBG_16_62_13]|uniref:DUF3379 domain-containing protein n=1 Tax=Candidatus Muproteobacteria bacterium RBG_16_62_13 TaxID=1817756 RepID=A0A1F6T538_9PROT|nr:MAG: hypothetical protein A2140_00705 [Candidatus Muproteobacteria bacterium RBG_16_62_13]
MNCLDFRRRLLTSPNAFPPEMIAHRDTCPACAGFADEQNRLERQLSAALRVATPDGMHARILLRQNLVEAHTRRRHLAMAASILLTVGIVGTLAWLTQLPPSIDRAVLEHVREEPDHLKASARLSPREVNTALGPLGVTLTGAPGEIRYAGVCDIRKKPGGHLVIAGRQGPVTVLLLPSEKTSAARRFRDGEWRGLILPANTGSMAIVGHPGEDLDEIARRLAVKTRG